VLDQAQRDQLIENNLGLVRRIAVRIQETIEPPLELDELEAYGTEGLVEAAGRWDPTRGASFVTFAYYRIRGAIFDGLRRHGWVGRRAHARSAAAANAYLANLAGRPPVPGRSTDQRIQDLARTLGNLATIMITSYCAPGEEEPLDLNSPNAFEALATKQARQDVLRALGRLPERERRLIEMHYYQDLPLAQAGEQLGMSRSWASRLHARAIDLLTAQLDRAHVQEE
jgi:RNA polymerase sigma factor for flagellar operon FliA